jgi:hypothetical protein
MTRTIHYGTLILALLATPQPIQATDLPTVSTGQLALKLDASAGVSGSSPVTAWSDQSGNAFDATLSSGAPVLVTNAFNSKSVIRFNTADGADAFSVDTALGTFLQNSELTIFMVTTNTIADTPVTDGDRLDGLFAGQQGSSGQLRTRFNAMNHVGASPGGIELVPSASGSVVIYRHTMRDDPGTASPSLVLSYDSLTIADSGNISINPVYTNIVTPGVGFSLMTLGLADGLGFTGDLAEFVIYRGALSDSDRNAVASALAVSYGMQPLPVPEPAGLGGLALAGLFALHHRRRRAS